MLPRIDKCTPNNCCWREGSFQYRGWQNSKTVLPRITHLVTYIMIQKILSMCVKILHKNVLCEPHEQPTQTRDRFEMSCCMKFKGQGAW